MFSTYSSPPVGLALVVGRDHVPVLRTGDAVDPGLVPVPDHLSFRPLVRPEEAQAPRDQLTSELRSATTVTIATSAATVL